MIFAAGIDGGGTKTAAELRDLNGRVLARKTFGALNLNSIGPENFQALMGEMTSWLQSFGSCAALTIGAAGVSNPDLRKFVAQAMKSAAIENWQLVGDQETALWGALEGRPGCVLIAGTGSICFGRNEQGVTARAGGWGHLIDDGGSGYALGRDALHLLVRTWDGRSRPGILTDLLSRQPQCRDAQTLIPFIYGGDKSRVAAFAPLVEQAASLGDPDAQAIVMDHAAALGALAAAVAKKLFMEEGEAALLGGLLTHDTFLRRETVRWLEGNLPGLRPVEPAMDAASGAALMALDMLK